MTEIETALSRLARQEQFLDIISSEEARDFTVTSSRVRSAASGSRCRRR